METRTVKKLEEKFEQTVAEITGQIGLSRLPVLPDRRTMHLKTKAAVTVYEAAVENQRQE